MTIDDKIKYEKLQHDINRKAVKISELSLGEFDKYAFHMGEEILPSDHSRIIEQAKFTYSLLETKTIGEQGGKQIKALEEHGKELVKSSGEKESITLLKQK